MDNVLHLEDEDILQHPMKTLKVLLKQKGSLLDCLVKAGRVFVKLAEVCSTGQV